MLCSSPALVQMWRHVIKDYFSGLGLYEFTLLLVVVVLLLLLLILLLFINIFDTRASAFF